jgi:dihydropteroate synthase
VDADSTGINALLVGIAGELSINYILTTEVSPRARGAVREASLARSLIQQAIQEKRVPKHLDDRLLTIKDPSGNSYNGAQLKEMQREIRDKNYRIFVAEQIYVFNAQCFLQGTSAREIFSQLDVKDPAHAFYLGKELGKAEIALQLGKKYVQTILALGLF